MPNHCDSDLFVYGPEDSIKSFMEFSIEDGNVLSANKYIPYPQIYKDQDLISKIARQNNDFNIADGFNSGGYEWCVLHWGTKWGIYDARLIDSVLKGKRSKVIYRLSSAWSPPNPVIFAMSNKYKDLRFKLKYYECGVGFKGIFEVKAGVRLTDSQSDYHGRRGG